MADSVTGPVRRLRGAAHRQVEDQVVIVLARTSETIVLNRTGSIIWELSDGTRDATEIAAVLAERFAIPEAEARDDVEQFYSEMIGAGAMEPAK